MLASRENIVNHFKVNTADPNLNIFFIADKKNITGISRNRTGVPELVSCLICRHFADLVLQLLMATGVK